MNNHNNSRPSPKLGTFLTKGQARFQPFKAPTTVGGTPTHYTQHSTAKTKLLLLFLLEAWRSGSAAALCSAATGFLTRPYSFWHPPEHHRPMGPWSTQPPAPSPQSPLFYLSPKFYLRTPKVLPKVLPKLLHKNSFDFC